MKVQKLHAVYLMLIFLFYASICAMQESTNVLAKFARFKSPLRKERPDIFDEVELARFFIVAINRGIDGDRAILEKKKNGRIEISDRKSPTVFIKISCGTYKLYNIRFTHENDLTLPFPNSQIIAPFEIAALLIEENNKSAIISKELARTNLTQACHQSDKSEHETSEIVNKSLNPFFD